MAKYPSGTALWFYHFFTTFAVENMLEYAKICENDKFYKMLKNRINKGVLRNLWIKLRC